MIRAEGGEAFACVADISQEADNERMADETIARYGRLDAVDLNAAVLGQHASFFDCTVANYDKIIAVNQRAFPYGGIELARLFDADQDVAANVGGRAPSAFGLLVRTPHGTPVFASQTGRARVDPNITPVRLTRAPTGTSATARSKSPSLLVPQKRNRARAICARTLSFFILFWMTA